MQSILSASIFVSAAGILSLVTAFASNIAIARILGAEGTGLTAFAFWVAVTFYAVANRGIPSVLLRYIARAGETGASQAQFVRTLYFRFLAPVLLCMVGFILFAVWDSYADGMVDAFVWLVTGLVFLTYSHSHLVIAANHGLGHFPTTARRTAIGCLFQIPATIAGAFLLGPAGAMLGYFFRHIPQLIGLPRLMAGASRDKVEIPDQMLRYGRSTWGASLLDQLVKTRVEFLFIGWYFSAVELGYFATGTMFSSLVVQLSLYLAAGLTPGFGKLRDSMAIDQLRTTYDRSLRWLTMLMLPVSFGGAVVMPTLVPLAFGADFAPAIPVATILVLFSLPLALTSVPMSAMLAYERDRTVLYFNGLSALALILLNFILTPTFGAEGAAWIRGGIGMTTFCILIIHCWSALKFKLSLSLYLRIVFSGICCGAAAYLVLAGIDGVVGLVLAILSGALAYFLAIRFTGAIPAEERLIIRSLVENKAPGSIRNVALRVVSLLG